MDRWLPRSLRGPGWLRRVTVVVLAAMLAACALGFLLWALTTGSTSRLAWLTSMAAILAVVLPSWGMSAAMLAWVLRSARTAHEAAVAGLGGSEGGSPLASRLDVAMRTAGAVPDPAVAPLLPAQPIFVGREAELSRLARALAPSGGTSAGDPVAVVAVAGLDELFLFRAVTISDRRR